MALPPGSTLASFQILGSIGAGAMGEVYRARDTRLGRDVAIKVLPETFVEDEERLQRFEREAKTLASLNHPNVAQIFEVDQVGDTCFLVLELVPGESLEDRLKRGPMPLDETVDYCRQIAEGLEAAHDAGVIHRDLKPANVRVTPDGKVKVLDFGLAKPMWEAGGPGSTTDSALATEAGRLLGTPTYMAPEQARGRSIDKRVDVWAFGCVLYECLTAKRAFAGETLSDVLAAVLEREADFSKLPASTPRHVRELLRRCFEKDPRRRMRDIGEARLILERGATTSPEEVASGALLRRHAWALALVWIASLAAAAWVTTLVLDRDVPTATGVTRASINLPPDLVLTRLDGGLALSPDGRSLAFIASRGDRDEQLWIRPLDSLVPQPLEGTASASYPTWSPDGRHIAFFADAKLKRMPVGGGSVTTLCAVEEHARGAAWTVRDEIVFARTRFGPLFKIPATGGTPVAVTQAPERASHRLPHALPGGTRILFTQDEAPEGNGIHLLDLESGATTRLSDDISDAFYVAPGELWFVRKGNLVSRPFDVSGGKLGAEARVLAESVRFDLWRCTGSYSVSPEGTLVYQSIGSASLQWFDMEGRALGRLGEPGPYVSVSVSRDGQRVGAVRETVDGSHEIEFMDGPEGLGVREAWSEHDWDLAWSPDGRSFAFAVGYEGGDRPMVRTSDGSADRPLAGPGFPIEWSRDGVWISLTQQNVATGMDVYVVRADGTGEPEPIATGAAEESSGSFSPDGRWILFMSDRSGRDEFYAAPFRRPGTVRPLTSVGVDGDPAWLDDGRILFLASSGEVVVLDLKLSENDIEVGKPRTILGAAAGGPAGSTSRIHQLSAARDGKRFLAVVVDRREMAQTLTLVQPRGGGESR